MLMRRNMHKIKTELISIVTGKNNESLLKYLMPAWINEGLKIIYIDQSSKDNSIAVARKFLGKGVAHIYSFTKELHETEFQIQSLKDHLRQHYAYSAFIEMDATQWIHGHKQGIPLKEIITSNINRGHQCMDAKIFIFPEVIATQQWMHYYHLEEKKIINIYPPIFTKNKSMRSRLIHTIQAIRPSQIKKGESKNAIVVREYYDHFRAHEIALEEASIEKKPQPSKRELLPPDASELHMLSHKKQHQLKTEVKAQLQYWNWDDSTKKRSPETIFGLYGCNKDKHFLDDFYKSTLYSTIAKDPNCLILEIWAGSNKTELNGRRLSLATEEYYGNLSIKTQQFIQYCYRKLNFSQIIKFDISCMRRDFKGRAFEGRQPLNLEKLDSFIRTKLGNPLKDRSCQRLEDHYSGFQLVQNPTFENIEFWARKKQATINPRKVFKSESEIPSFYTGKCYAISQELSKFIAQEGYAVAHQHKKLLNGSEDLMIARIAKKMMEIKSRKIK